MKERARCPAAHYTAADAQLYHSGPTALRCSKIEDSPRMPGADIADTLRSLKQRPIIVASHPRSGTHLAMDLFRRQFRECRSWKLPGERLNRLYLSVEALFVPGSRAPISERQAVKVLRRVGRPIVKTHLALPDLRGGPTTRSGEIGQYWLDWLLGRGRVVYVYRDGRDVMCSYHFFSLVNPSARCLLGEFIRQEDGGVSRVKAWAQSVRRWLREPGVLALRCEDILRDPKSVVERLARELELTPLYREPLLPRQFGSFWESRANRIFGIRPASTAILSRFKGYRLQRWRDVLTVEDRAFFHRESGDLLTELGYEDSAAWVDAEASR